MLLAGQARKGIILYGARVAYGALLLVASVIIGRTFGATGLGLYTLLLTITNLGSIVGNYGTSTLVIERVAHHRESPMAQSALLKAMLRTVLVVGTAATAVSLAVGYFLVPSLWWAALTVLPIALSTLFLGYLVGTRRQLLSAALESLMRPTVFIGLLLWFGFIANLSSSVTIGAALLISLGLLTVATGYFYGRGIRATAPPSREFGTAPRYALLPAAGAAYMVIALLTAAGQQLDRFVMQVLGSTSEVGLYASAQNIMNIVNYAMLALMSLLLPAIADHYAGRLETSAFLARVKLVARGLTGLAFLVLIVCIFAGPLLLSLFGSEFRQAHLAMVILSIGQLIGAMLGQGTTVLSMGQYRATAVWITGLSVVVDVGASLLLVPLLGIEGAAIANSSALILNRLTGWIIAKRRLGLELSAL